MVLTLAISFRDVSDNGRRRDHQRIAAEQVGQMLTSAVANCLLAAAEEPPPAH
jgi:hypothetical protein